MAEVIQMSTGTAIIAEALDDASDPNARAYIDETVVPPVLHVGQLAMKLNAGSAGLGQGYFPYSSSIREPGYTWFTQHEGPDVTIGGVLITSSDLLTVGILDQQEVSQSGVHVEDYAAVQAMNSAGLTPQQLALQGAGLVMIHS